MFSIGAREVEGIKEYIQNQEEHHRKISCQDEYRSFLREFGIERDDQYVWD